MRRFVGAWTAVAVISCVAFVASASADISTPTPICSVADGAQVPCGTGWYTSPVSLTWAPDGTVITSGCGSQYVAQDTDGDAVANVNLPQWEQCSFNAGNVTATIFYRVHVELSSPAATAVPSRTPDGDGWYNHPVSVSFGGSSFSGIASCTAPEAYGGPNTAGLTVSGTCTDNAGKTAPASYTLAYDASPPAVSAAADAGDSVINVNWQASSTPAPLASVEIARSPGIDASAASILYRGTSGAYKDTRVRNKIRYTYTITAVDQAGNTAVRTVVATPGARLLSPAAGAKISKPPTLAWTAVPKARYYNVQLWQGSHKILSEWPKRATLDLKRTWRFAGRAHRLKRGRYRWYVWPGFATRKAARYGSLVGSATFVVA